MVRLLHSNTPWVYEKDQCSDNSNIPYADHYTLPYHGDLVRLQGTDPGHSGYYTTTVVQGIVMDTPPEVEHRTNFKYYGDTKDTMCVYEDNWMQFKWEVIDQLLPIYDHADDWNSGVGLDKEIVDQTEWDSWHKTPYLDVDLGYECMFEDDDDIDDPRRYQNQV